LFACFLLSAQTQCGAQRESGEKGWEKRLCMPVRQGKHVCVGGKQAVLGKRRQDILPEYPQALPIFNRKEKKKKSLDLVHSSSPWKDE